MGQCQEEEALSPLKDTINVMTKSSIMKHTGGGVGEGVMENTDKDNHALVKGNPERIHLI